MDRKIKFRAWVDCGGERGKPKMVKVSILHLDADKRIGYKTKRGSMGYLEPESLMQFTGLHDKTGKEIYEGDIYKCDYNDTFDFAYYQVVWDEEKGQWWSECVALHHKDTGYKDISRGGFCESSVASSVNIKVIGNIHENPELLKKT